MSLSLLSPSDACEQYNIRCSVTTTHGVSVRLTVLSAASMCTCCALPGLAAGETVILLHPPLPSAGVTIGMERGCQQNNSLADGYPGPIGCSLEAM